MVSVFSRLSSTSRYRAGVVAIAIATGGCAVHHAPEPSAGPQTPSAATELHLGLRSVAGDPGADPRAPASTDQIVLLADGVAADPATVAAQLLGPGCDWRLLRAYPQLGAFAVRAAPPALARLTGDPRVAAVTADRTLRTQATAGQVVGATKARALLGLAGAGVRIALIDSGVDAAHPDLAGRVVAQQCFSQAGCPGGGKQGPSAADVHGHGTHVASTLVGAGKLAPAGIAPEARLVAVRVFGKDGTGPTSDLLAGLDWLIGQVALHKVRVLNLSLGSSDVFAGPCDAWDPTTAKALKILSSKGVLTFAAAGNDAASGKLATPGCLTAAVPVGATYAASYGAQTYGKLCTDSATSSAKLACFSNRSAQLKLVAPGAFLAGAFPGAKVASLAGTSQAVPVVAATAALLVGCNPGLPQAQVHALLVATAKPLNDKASGLTFGLVQAAAAGKAACPWLGPGVSGKP
ncbi:MAG: S8 family serine peptidase [Deltaproteobacteria bacterium]|nr:S8 family serine peptidase [Deltaproteobacteria bacterium]